jgi:hypothetical protein
MCQAKYLIYSAFGLSQEDFLGFYYIHNIGKSMTPWAGPQGFYLNKLD